MHPLNIAIGTLMPAALNFFPSGVIFPLVSLVVGFLPAALTFAFRPHAADAIGLTRVPLPPWVFILVWLLIYSGMGIAAWIIVQQVQTPDMSIPLVVLGVGLLQTTTFWFTDSLRTTAVMDATGTLFAAMTLFVVAHYVPVAALWLVPWMVWMPITFAIKLAALRGTTPKGSQQ